MSSKDKSVQDKLKQLFRFKGSNITKERDFVLTEEILRELSRESPTNVRIKTLKMLSDTVLQKKLQENAIERLWTNMQDLLSADHSVEVRHLALSFLQCLLKGQSERLGMLRAHFFRVIKQHKNTEDTVPTFELFQSLTDNGKDILYFEEEVGPFLLEWFPEITRAGKTLDFIGTLVNIIKFNAAYIDENIANGLVQHICILCCSTNQEQVTLSCLNVLDTLVAYSNLPPASVLQFIGTLCRTVNCPSYSTLSWKIMRNLLGTHMGHSALYTMCKILQEPSLKDDSTLLRGAVFYIKMALWDAQPLSNLKCPQSSVLPSFLEAVKSNQAGVIYEIALSIQLLVNKHGLELLRPAWDIILTILSIIVKHTESAPNQQPYPFISRLLHDTLDNIESLVNLDSFNGSVKQFFELIEDCASTRPESSVLHLISYLSENIIPIKHLWLTNLYNILQKYFKPDVRTNIRLKVLEILSNVVKLHRRHYEDELIDRIVIPHMINIVNDSDVVVRSSVAKLLVDLCLECDTKRCLELLDILERMLARPFEIYDNNHVITDSQIVDVVMIITGLVEVFSVKIYRLPSSHAVKIYKMLVNHLDLHYTRPKLFENCNQPRLLIFKAFLKMRADSLYRLGYPDVNGKMKYSSYLCAIYHSLERGPLGSPPPTSPAVMQQPACTITNLSLKNSFKVVTNCLKLEKDWEVLRLVLQELPQVLQNKSLILTKQGNNEVDLLVDAVCGLITDKSLSLPESLNTKVSRPDFHSLVLPAVASLASYHAFIDTVHQQTVIRCLMKYGFGPRCSRQCITALTTCTLEMRDVMVKMLPEALLILSKISATVYIAIPVLEFLSTLTQLPMVFANFVADQYMAVFAISLPYTNPFKYDHYIVSLAHHVIAVWFLKCRLPFRKDFVKFITNGLQTNVLTPFEETSILKSDLSKLNQDSSDRKRSSSLTEQGSRRRERPVSVVGKSAFEFHRPPIDRNLLAFYEELTETCIDLMARYTFSPSSALPKRLPVAEFLLSGGQSLTWLVGNRLITVTTSGCSQQPLKHGLCDKCWSLCRQDNVKTSEGGVRTTRSGSNEKDECGGSNRASRQNSDDKSNNTSTSSPLEENKRTSDKLEQLPSKLQQLVNSDGSRPEKNGCACWCQGWAEIYVRRPTGDMSWVMRIQNQVSYQHSLYDFPLNEISTLFMPSLYGGYDFESYDNQYQADEATNLAEEDLGTTTMPISIPGSPTKNSPSRQNSRDSIRDDDDEDCSKSRNPVRRSNSSPEMSANWKNPFLLQKQQEREKEENTSNEDDGSKKSKNYQKDVRVSCEAIPEEIAGMGTTPPSQETLSSVVALTKPQQPETPPHHPTLLSCHSYPGSSETNLPGKPYKTVPPSPGVVQNPPLARNPALGLLKTSRSESMESVGSDKSILSNLSPLSSKPPQSPTQTSPRLPRHAGFKERESQELQKSSSLVLEKSPTTLNINLTREKTKEKKTNPLDRNETTQKRDRGYTISVMSPARKPQPQTRQANPRPKDSSSRSGINPSFVFLQLFHAATFGSPTERPLLVDSKSQVVQRALRILDSIHPFETHRIGVIYIKQGQSNNETEILRNRFGSVRYVDFLHKLGTLIKLEDVDPQLVFIGGMEQNGSHGRFAYIWQDDVIKVAFHVATLMPNKDTDPNCNNKKMLVGNNNVTIVYNESGEDYNINTIKGQFNFASIVIQPLDHNTNRVTVKAKDELRKLMGESDIAIVSDQNLAILARQLALHANLASLVLNSLKLSENPYASNWLERLRRIKNVREKILKEQPNTTAKDPSSRTRRGQMEDFTEYT